MACRVNLCYLTHGPLNLSALKLSLHFHRKLDPPPIPSADVQGLLPVLNNDSSLSQLALCVAGDVERLGIMIRTQIGKLLDPSNEGHDWKELAKKLGLETLITPISFSKAPTKALLDNYEVVYPYYPHLIQQGSHQGPARQL